MRSPCSRPGLPGRPAIAGKRRADLLVRVLIAEGRFDRAWELARDGGVGHDLAETLARATEASHPREALAVYARRVDQLANIGGNANYAGAAELVARMAGLRDAAEQAAYVTELKDRHRRRRNFVKLWSELVRRAAIDAQNRILLDRQRASAEPPTSWPTRSPPSPRSRRLDRRLKKASHSGRVHGPSGSPHGQTLASTVSMAG